MAAPSKLSGYTSQSPIDQQDVTYNNPTFWIQEAMNDMPILLAGHSGRQIENQLNIVNTCAQEIINSIGVGRAVDAQGQIIDCNTQIDELMHLSADIHAISAAVKSKINTNESLTRYASDFPSKGTAKKRLEAECDRSANLVKQMTARAAALHNQLKRETAVLTDQLLNTIESLPKDCLGIIAQYSIL